MSDYVQVIREPVTFWLEQYSPVTPVSLIRSLRSAPLRPVWQALQSVYARLILGTCTFVRAVENLPFAHYTIQQSFTFPFSAV